MRGKQGNVRMRRREQERNLSGSNDCHRVDHGDVEDGRAKDGAHRHHGLRVERGGKRGEELRGRRPAKQTKRMRRRKENVVGPSKSEIQRERQRKRRKGIRRIPNGHEGGPSNRGRELEVVRAPLKRGHKVLFTENRESQDAEDDPKDLCHKDPSCQKHNKAGQWQVLSTTGEKEVNHHFRCRRRGRARRGRLRGHTLQW